MARTLINDADPVQDEFPLSSGLGVDLWQNLAEGLTTRLKRHAITYYLGDSDQTGSTPPTGDTDIVGPLVDVQGSAANDSEAIGLRISSPPTTPVALYLGDWPLSAFARRIRLIVSCTTENAPVALFACAVMDGGAVPFAPRDELVQAEDGVVTFSPAVQGSDAYVEVGLSTPSATEDAKPVELVIDFGPPRGRDLGKHGNLEDARGECRLYLCILSTEGSDQGQIGVVSLAEDGRRVITNLAIAGITSGNPGPLHMWIRWNGPPIDRAGPIVRGVVQVTTEGPAEDAGLVVHPPIVAADSVQLVGMNSNLYSCGVIGIRVISIQELAE